MVSKLIDLLVAGIFECSSHTLRKNMIVFNVKRNTLHISLSNIQTQQSLGSVLLNDHKTSKESPIFPCVVILLTFDGVILKMVFFLKDTSQK